MNKVSHYLGGILLVAGTTIGAGMLALPVSTAFIGFVPSLFVFLICYLVMLATANFFLDVNMQFKGEANLISMAHKTLGLWGQIVSWIFYVLLLYSLLAAYISASTPVFVDAITFVTSWKPPEYIAVFSLPLIFGGFLYLGTLGVDIINRLLMLGLVVSFLLLIALLPSSVEPTLLTHFDLGPIWVAFPIVITSFGYHIIIPSLTSYMNHDRKHLKRVLVYGSLLPLIIYLIWQCLILGIVPLTGKQSLVSAWQSGLSATSPLSYIVSSKLIKLGANFFTFFAIVTSFLGVALSLSDFLKDGLRLKKGTKGKLLAIALTFVPPLAFVLAYKRGFIIALQYAGAFVAILLIFLPAIMAWHLKAPAVYQKLKTKVFLTFIMLFALFIVVLVFMTEKGMFKELIAPYLGS